MKKYIGALACFLFAFLPIGHSQEPMSTELHFEVNKVYPYISISKEELKNAQSLKDLNFRYKPSWVREYIAVEISTSQKGKRVDVIGKNDILSPEQKDLLYKADPGSAISVKISYIPENTLSQKEQKEMDFTFIVDPDKDAAFPGGLTALEQYLKTKAIDKIPDGSFVNYDLAAVTFTVNEEGEIINPQLFEGSKTENIDNLLLETIRNMPCWNPATYTDGTTTKQTFALTVGNMENCMVNLLNIYRK